MKLKTSFSEVLRNLVLIVALCGISCGCATWSHHGVVLDSRKVRIAVLPVRNAVPVKRLSDIQTVSPDSAVSTNEQDVVQREMRNVTEQIGGRIEKGLARSYFFQPISSEQVSAAARMLDIDLGAPPLSADQLKQMGRSLDADAVLIVTVSGYGKIKKKWFYLLVGSGLAEGVVQGVVAAVVVDNVWVAVGVAAEEILQEALTWGGGTYLFNRVFTPVIIEAALVSTSDGRTVWRHTAFARMHRKALKQLPEAEQGKKEVRLRLTSERAIDDLLGTLDKKAVKNIKYRGLEVGTTGEARTSNSTVRAAARP